MLQAVIFRRLSAEFVDWTRTWGLEAMMHEYGGVVDWDIYSPEPGYS